MNTITSIRIPPHSAEAEECVLGAILLDRDAIIAVAQFLASSDFYDEKNKLIYEACLFLYEERTPIDVLTVTEKLKKAKVLKKIGGASLLAEFVNKVPTAAHVEHYARIVKDAAIKRSLVAAAGRLIDISMDEGSAADVVLDKAEAEVFALTQRHLTKGFVKVKDALADAFDRLDELHKQGAGLRGVPTGFVDLDDTLAGLQRSNLLILAARPGVGKTSLAINITENVAVKYKRPVAFFSLEMSQEELLERLLVGISDIDAWKLKTGKLNDEDFTKLSNAMGVLAEAPIYIDDTPALSILEMRTKARRLQVEVGIDLLIVDYLQLARSRQLENRVQEVSEISQGLKNLARELKIPVLAVSQLSRAVEQRGTKRPQLADLRESGCLHGDTKILDINSGQDVTIESLVDKGGITTLALDKKMKLKKAKISSVFPSGKKIVYSLILKSGKIIKASGNHPFLKLYGWERLDKLKPKDRIAVPRQICLDLKTNGLSDNRIVLLAHLIGDGCFVRRQPLHYTNSDLKLIDVVKKAAVSEFKISPRLVRQKNWFHLYLSASEKLARGKRNPVVKWLDKDLGIYGQHSREKIIPDAIFSLSDKKISLFLKHLWSTDGSITISSKRKGPRVRVYYASGSRKLARGVGHLLLRLGIISRISASRKNRYADIWNVIIQGKNDQQKFLQVVGSVGEKKAVVIKALSILDKIEQNPNNDVIPKDIWKYIEKLRIQRKLTTRRLHFLMNWAYSGTQRYGSGISRRRLAKIAKVLDSKILKNLAMSDLYWDEVKSIKKLGIQKVYDATVPGYANFIAEDIIVHNSIEQDADVVMFLWREDEENLENVVLDIAKHRNGPLKSLKLFFRGDRIKFYGRETKRR